MWWIILGCAPLPDCADGFIAVGDAHCRPEVPPAVVLDDALFDLPCEPIPDPALLLDLDARCAGEVCIGHSLADANARAGLSSCSRSGEVSACNWADLGLTAFFVDDDADGQPDPGSTIFQWVVGRASLAATSVGTGPAASLGCAVQEFGLPERIDYRADDVGGLAAARMSWNTLGLHLFDDPPYDGTIDTLYGASP